MNKKVYDIETFECEYDGKVRKEYAVFHEGQPIMGTENLWYAKNYILKTLKGKYILHS